MFLKKISIVANSSVGTFNNLHAWTACFFHLPCLMSPGGSAYSALVSSALGAVTRLQLFILFSCGNLLACHLPSKEEGSLHKWSLKNQCWLMHLMCSDKATVTVFLLLPEALMDISSLSLHIEGGGTHGHVIFMNHCWLHCNCIGNALDRAFQQVAHLDVPSVILADCALIQNHCYGHVTVLSLFKISYFLSMANVPQRRSE